MTPGLARRLGVGHNVAQEIMERLEREGYIRPPAKGRKCVQTDTNMWRC